eukprot:TRINITY_DN1541_c0_g1_i1.p1 TRINITY_DN1541_c0_g1~~TRINITY_DN1541_c0_g1_i1.p1  ORF type:complete len:717 (-),score=269.76 TRINITY_DN1541_c0_g1_i1:120-2192(-)
MTHQDDPAVNIDIEDSGRLLAVSDVFDSRHAARLPSEELLPQDAASRNSLFLAHFIDADNSPFVTPLIASFLSEPGVTEMLMDFITQPLYQSKKAKRKSRKAEAANALSTESAAKIEEISPRSDDQSNPSANIVSNRGRSDQGAMIRAYKVAHLFFRPSAIFVDYMIKNRENIVHSLMRIFEKTSGGSFHHFRLVFLQICTTFKDKVLEIFQAENCMERMLEHLHEIPVAEALGNFLQLSFASVAAKRSFYAHLAQIKFFHHIGEKIYGQSATGDNPVCAVDFCKKLFDDLCTLPQSDLLFRQIISSTELIDGLSKVLADYVGEYSPTQKIAAANMINTLLYQTERVIQDNAASFDGVSVTNTTVEKPNSISVIKEGLYEQLFVHTQDICSALQNSIQSPPSAWRKYRIDEIYPEAIEFSSCTIQKPLGIYRLTLVEILVYLANKDAERFLDLMIPSVWRFLCNWFFEHSNNNMFQAFFFKLFSKAVLYNHSETVQNILQKQKFTGRLISNLQEEPKSACRGFAITICNVIRLAADAQATDFLRTYLASNEKWKSFQPYLRLLTYGLVKEAWIVPESGYDSDGMLIEGSESAPTGRGMTEIDTSDVEVITKELEALQLEGCDSIDLGSPFADKLGFDHLPVLLKKALASNETVCVASPRAGPTTTTPKKKKNKKKKAKKTGVQGAPEADN